MNEILRFMQKRDERTDVHTEGVLLSPDHGLRPAGDNNKPNLYNAVVEVGINKFIENISNFVNRNTALI